MTTTLLAAEPGVFPCVPAAIYHGWEGASNSRLTKFHRSPAHMIAALAEPVDTKALHLGRALHTTILEPDTFDALYTVARPCTAFKKGDGQPCTNGGVAQHAVKGWRCGIHQKGETDEWVTGQTVLSADDHQMCHLVRRSIQAHQSASSLLAGDGECELSVRWQDDETGVLCKARLDRLTRDIAGGAIVDIKSTKDASKSAFERAIYTYGYHRQAAMYLDGAKALGLAAEHFVIVAVEKEPPYAVAVYRLTEGAIDAGRDQLRVLLARYADCVARNHWPAYPDEVQDIALPNYAWSQISEEVTA